MTNRIVILICTSIFILFNMGCNHGKQYDYYADPKIIHEIQKQIDNLSRNNEKYLTTEELIVKIGEPEIKIKVYKLPEFLTQELSDPEEVCDQMQRIYRNFAADLAFRSMSVQVDGNAWHKSERFNNLNIWLYNYKTPMRVRTQVSMFIPITYYTGIVGTDYFLIEKQNIISCSTLLSKRSPGESRE